MTSTELKNTYPATYNSIFNSGVQAEKSRVSGWMEHADSNLEVVKEGIKSDEHFSEEAIIKSHQSLTAQDQAELAALDKAINEALG